MESKLREELREKYDELTDLMKSKEWAHWISFLRRRKADLQEKVNTAVEQDDKNAKVYKALMDDCDTQIKLFLSEYNKTAKQIREN